MDGTGKSSVLIVDDDPGIIKTVVKILSRLDASLVEGLEKAGQDDFDVVLLDVNLPDGNGLDRLGGLLHKDFPPLVIVMTAFCDPDEAQLAIEIGAWDYLAKPVSPKELRLQVFRALEYQRQARQAKAIGWLEAPEIIGTSPGLQSGLAQAARFRFDLLYRLKTFILNLPPLRGRKDDIWPIFEYQIQKICRDHKVPEKEVPPDLIEALKGHDWPGNVRELINTIEGTVTTAHNESILFAFHLPATIRAKIVRSRVGERKFSSPEMFLQTSPGKIPGTHRETMDRAERDYLSCVHSAEGRDIQPNAPAARPV